MRRIDTIFDLKAILVSARKAKGWTQTQLAKELGVTQGVVAKFESDSTDLSFKTIKKLFQALDLDIYVGQKDSNAPEDYIGI